MSGGPKVDNISNALTWITEILNKEGVSHQMVGGLAARAYGATRSVLDIDLYIPKSGLSKILPHVSAYTLQGPERFTSDLWDVDLLTLEFEGQEIGINVAEDAKIFDSISGSWISAEIDFSDFCLLEVEGVDVPVMPVERLIKYKTVLARDVDLQDIKEIYESRDTQ
jgi:hypothetical protein